MMNKRKTNVFILLLTLLALGSVILAACARPGAPSRITSTGGGSNPSGPGTVHMTSDNFAVASVSIAKGSMLTLVNDAAVPHIIQNGSWVGGNQKPMQEKGAPAVNVNFTGNDTKPVGPFNTAGTYHLFCTVHTNMNLTVTVK